MPCLHTSKCSDVMWCDVGTKKELREKRYNFVSMGSNLNAIGNCSSYIEPSSFTIRYAEDGNTEHPKRLPCVDWIQARLHHVQREEGEADAVGQVGIQGCAKMCGKRDRSEKRAKSIQSLKNSRLTVTSWNLPPHIDKHCSVAPAYTIAAAHMKAECIWHQWVPARERESKVRKEQSSHMYRLHKLRMDAPLASWEWTQWLASPQAWKANQGFSCEESKCRVHSSLCKEDRNAGRQWEAQKT